jgi:site-specific recombinase XerD
VDSAGEREDVAASEPLDHLLKPTAGLAERITPRTLRNACATHLLASGVELQSLQTMLGHTDIATTQAVHRDARRRLTGRRPDPFAVRSQRQ